MESDNKSREELLAEAEKVRRDAQRHRTAALLVDDHLVEETLRSRAVELDTLAEMLEARAAKVGRT